jgi:hypothetical protein
MLPRIMIGATVPLGVLSGIALTSGVTRWLRVTLAIAVVCTSAIGLVEAVFNPAHVKPDWRAMLPLVAERLATGDLVVVGPHASILGLAHAPFDLCRATNVRSWQREPEQATAVSWLETAACRRRLLTTEEIAAQIQAGQKLWLLLDSADEQALAAEPVAPATTRLARPGLALLGW